jgi:hypothetical protein
MALTEPFSRTRDEQHPVRWSPADGDTPAYLTLKGAGERLARYFGETHTDPDEAAQMWIAELQTGRPLRTPFAFYQIDEETDR